MSSIFVIFTISPFFKGCFSAPVETVHWQSPPDGRGTFDLVISCVITLTLCIWTSLHLNIAAPNESVAHYMARKFGWTMVALLAPELVVLVAWCQWSSARYLSTAMNRILDSESRLPVRATERETRNAGPDSVKAKRRWTITHGFYAVMGGFTIEIDPSTKSFIPDMIDRDSPVRLTLTARGVHLLAKCGRLPPLSALTEESIADKSKADSLAKTIVCVQALWSVLQIIGRYASQLPITLLEINTMGHVLCALAIYICWWSKPQDVSVPTVLSGEWVPPICAYMWMNSKLSSEAAASARGKPELRSVLLNVSKGTQGKSGSYRRSKQHEAEPTSRVIDPRPDVTSLGDGQTLAYTAFTLHRPWLNPPSPVGLLPMDVRRWQLASEALRATPAILNHYDEKGEGFYNPRGKDDAGIRYVRDIRGDELLVNRAPNIPGGDLLRGTNRFLDVIALILTSVAYGGLHAAAWNSFFPTVIEQWIWRVSSVYVLAFGFYCTILLLVAWMRDRRTINGVILLSAFYFLASLYFLCKFFFVVESFVSIRELPVDAYKTPDWTRFIPHL